MILVIGATGQLGSRVVRKLLERGEPVRVMVRNEEAARRFEALGCESYLGDITIPGQAKGPLPRVHTIVATANAAVPSRRQDSIRRVELQGYRNLIRAALDAGWIRQFIHVSVCSFAGDTRVPLFAAKRQTERELASSGLAYTILRLGPFMDTTLPMLGYSAPLAQAENPTLRRDFARAALERAERSLQKGVIRLLSPGVPQPYICVEDAANLLVAVTGRQDFLRRTLEITGPEARSQEDLARLIEKRLGRTLQRQTTPAGALRVVGPLLRWVNPPLANLLAIQYFNATSPIPVQGQEIAAQLGVRLTRVEQYLEAAGPVADGLERPVAT